MRPVTAREVEEFLRAFYAADDALGYEGWDDFNPDNKVRLRGLAQRALTKFIATREGKS